MTPQSLLCDPPNSHLKVHDMVEAIITSVCWQGIKTFRLLEIQAKRETETETGTETAKGILNPLSYIQALHQSFHYLSVT